MAPPQYSSGWSVLFAVAGIGLWAVVLRADEKPLRQVIDAHVRAAWQQKKITPAAQATDGTFLRRVYLDLVGTIPTYQETRQFLEDKDGKKRQKLIEKLLADPRFAVQQANVWDLVLFGRNPPGGDETRYRDGFRKWLADKFSRNESYDRWVRSLLLAEPGTELFHVQHRNQPEEAAVTVSRIFLGTQLQCARCHDHPFESWTQKDFYGMAGFFVRLVVQDKGGSGPKRRFVIGEKSTGEVLFTGAVKDQKPGQKGQPVKPKFLGGAVLEEPPLPKNFKEASVTSGQPLPGPLFSRKEKLAAWVTAADNPYFARAVVNRVWAQFLGRGLVHPIDDLSEKNSASHPDLFKPLTRQLIAHKFDLKWLIGELVNSETYQRAATGPTKEALPPWFERARVRPLSAEELLAALRTATGFDASGQKVQGDTIEYVVRYFGEPYNGRGEFQGGLSEHLFLNNSDNVRRMIQRHKGNLADALVSSKDPWERKVDRLFLAVLNRPPRTAERAKFVAHLTSGDKPEALVEEAIWVLLNCAEFRFNH
jgi:hypothetical protein